MSQQIFFSTRNSIFHLLSGVWGGVLVSSLGEVSLHVTLHILSTVSDIQGYLIYCFIWGMEQKNKMLNFGIVLPQEIWFHGEF
jgi:hypothetical protein